MEDSPIGKSRGRPRKIISEIIRRYLDFNGLNVNMIFDRPLWYCLIHAINSTNEK